MSDSYNQQINHPNARFSIDPDDKLGENDDQPNNKVDDDNELNLDVDDREQIDLSSNDDDNSDAARQNNVLDDTDAKIDKAAKRFIDALRKVGPHSKHILNYSYPPLLYQRGDDEEEDDEESADQGECDEDTEASIPNSNSQDIEGAGMGQLPEFHDSDDDELIALGGALEHPNTKHHHGDGDDDSENKLKGGDDQFFKRLQQEGGSTSKDANRRHDDGVNGQQFYHPGQDQISDNISGNRISGLEGVIGEDHDFSDDEDEMGIVGGHATNLDGLDKDQIMKMID